MDWLSEIFYELKTCNIEYKNENLHEICNYTCMATKQLYILHAFAMNTGNLLTWYANDVSKDYMIKERSDSFLYSKLYLLFSNEAPGGREKMIFQN